MIRSLLATPLRRQARAAARRGDWSAAVAAYRRLEAIRIAGPADRVQLSHALKEAGDLDGALAAYRAVATAYPLDLEAQRQLALFFRRVGRSGEAVEVLSRVLAVDPAAADVRAELAGLGIDDAALEERLLTGTLRGERIARRSSSGVGRRIARRLLRSADAHARRGAATAALRGYRQAAADPSDPELAAHAAHGLLSLGYAEEAVTVCRRALFRTPRAPGLYLALAAAQQAIGQEQAALQAELAAWRLQPGRPAAAAALRRRGWSDADLERLTVASWSPTDPAASRYRSLPLPLGMDSRERTIWMHLAAAMRTG